MFHFKVAQLPPSFCRSIFIRNFPEMRGKPFARNTELLISLFADSQVCLVYWTITRTTTPTTCQPTVREGERERNSRFDKLPPVKVDLFDRAALICRPRFTRQNDANYASRVLLQRAVNDGKGTKIFTTAYVCICVYIVFLPITGFLVLRVTVKLGSETG